MQININTKTWIPILVVSSAIIGAVYFLIGREEPLPEGLIQTNGRIEGDHYTVASKMPGRITKLLVREGDEVVQGQTVIQLEETQVCAKVKQAQYAASCVGIIYRPLTFHLHTFPKIFNCQLLRLRWRNTCN